MPHRVITGVLAAVLLQPLGLLAEGPAQALPRSVPQAVLTQAVLTQAVLAQGPGPIGPVDRQSGFAPGTVDPLDIGQATAPAVPPSRQRKLFSAQQAPDVGTLPFEFRTSGVQPRLPEERFRPWRDLSAALEDTAPHDADGVRKYALGGTLYDHPVQQSQWALANLSSFRRTGDPLFLGRARANADRLLQTATDAGGVLYFGYPFDFVSPAHDLSLKAPWYSGMAQGLALSLLSELAQTEGVAPADQARYHAAADQTFLSFLRGPDLQPWTVHADKDGYLWLQEFPNSPDSASDFTLNGHMFASLGLWDYYVLSQQESARVLFDGAVTTIQKYAPELRTAGWISRYCVPDQVRAERYHYIHDSLALQLSWLTGRAALAGLSDDLQADYPRTDLSGTVQFAAGTHYAYRFSSTGSVTATTKRVLYRPSSASASRRVRIKGRGVYYLVSTGGLSGYYVEERQSTRYLRGQRLLASYDPVRRATFVPGTYGGRRFDPVTGAVTGSRQLRVGWTSSAPVDARALINGLYWVRVSAGPLADYWLPASTLTLAR